MDYRKNTRGKESFFALQAALELLYVLIVYQEKQWWIDHLVTMLGF